MSYGYLPDSALLGWTSIIDHLFQSFNHSSSCPPGMQEREKLASQEPLEQLESQELVTLPSGDSAGHLRRPNSFQIVEDDGEELLALRGLMDCTSTYI